MSPPVELVNGRPLPIPNRLVEKAPGSSLQGEEEEEGRLLLSDISLVSTFAPQMLQIWRRRGQRFLKLVEKVS